LQINKGDVFENIVLHSSFIIPLILGYLFEQSLKGYIYQLSFMFVPFVVICSIFLIKTIKELSDRVRVLFVFIVICLSGFNISKFIEYFPYYHLRFNSFIGELKGASSYGEYGWIDIPNNKEADLQILKKLDKYIRKNPKKYIQKPTLSPCRDIEDYQFYMQNKWSFDIVQTWKKADMKIIYPHGLCSDENYKGEKIVFISVAGVEIVSVVSK
jgi:hypothetical protein